LLTWQQQVGPTGLFPVSDQSADSNGDGVVNGADLTLWSAAFPTAAAAASISAAAAAAVPEPVSSLLAALMLLAAAPRFHAG
jgi:hypothetical protein